MKAPVIPVLLATLACAQGLAGRARAFAQAAASSEGCSAVAAQVEEAKSWVKLKQYDRAIALLQAAAEHCPQDHAVALELARTYLEARRFPEADQVTQGVLASDPRSEPAQFLLAYSYFMQKRFPEAGKTLQKLLAQNNDNPEAHKLMGLTLFFYKEYVMAEHELRVALAKRPQDTEALYYLGRVYYTQNNFRTAGRPSRGTINRPFSQRLSRVGHFIRPALRADFCNESLIQDDRRRAIRARACSAQPRQPRKVYVILLA